MSLILTLAVCITWLALAIGFCGIGVLWLRRLTGFQADWQNAYVAVWAGFALVMGGLLVWHFFLPVNGLALWVFAFVAAACLILERDWFRIALLNRLSASLVVPVFLFMVWTANHALAPGGMDDYNYEFQAIRWFHDYRIVPGLANLHGRIGFNNSHHLLAALLSSGPWAGGVNHIFNGFFVVLAFTLFAAALRDLALSRGSAWALPGALMISPCVGLVLFGIFGPTISTLKADVFVCVATAAMAVLFIEFAHTPVRDARYLALAATILPVAAVLFSVKMTAVVFSETLAISVLMHLLATVGWRNRVTLCSVLVATLIFCAVLVRGVFLSGYPLYPSTMLAANVDWRVPIAQANAERAFVTSWAQLRATYETPVTGWAWIPAWARSTILTDKFDIVLPLILALLCVPSLLLSFRNQENSRDPAWGWVTLTAASLGSISVWFVLAPAGRFASIYFWILFAVALMIALRRAGSLSRWAFALGTGIMTAVAMYFLFKVVGVPHEFRAGMLMMLAFSFLWLNSFRFVNEKRHAQWVAVLCLALGLFQIGDRVLAHLSRRRFAEIVPMLWLPITTLPERLERDQYVPHQTRQGTIVYVALKARYETPLPNTRFFDPALELRVPGDLAKGFRNPNPMNSARYGYSVRVVITDKEDREIITPDH